MHGQSRVNRHALIDDPVPADLILLAGDLESLAEAQDNILLRTYPEKTMAYSEIDQPIFYVPGVYASASNPRVFDPRRTQSSIYLSRYNSSYNPEVRHRPSEQKDLLFCFQGRGDCRLRAKLLSHSYHRQDVQVLETSGFMHWQRGLVGKNDVQKSYADTLARSHFALCPRGMGFGSIRLFEVMEMGIAPVLLSNRYALPPGPNWNSFLLRVPEHKYSQLPQILDSVVHESETRGRLARKAWEEFFAPDLIFNQLIDQLCEIRTRRIVPESFFRLLWPLLNVRTTAKEALSNAIGTLQAQRSNESRMGPPQQFE